MNESTCKDFLQVRQEGKREVKRIQKNSIQFYKCSKITNSHDRFLIIDNTVYHIGASLKDLGKKWFAFCKMSFSAADVVGRIR